MADFQVGNYVRIKQWEEMQAEFGLSPTGHIACDGPFRTGMKPLCGLVGYIEDIYYTPKMTYVFLDIEDCENVDMTTDMLVLISAAEVEDDYDPYIEDYPDPEPIDSHIDF